MDAAKHFRRAFWLRAFWPQWVPALLAAGATLWAFWGLPLIVLLALTATVGGGVFLLFTFAGLAWDW